MSIIVKNVPHIIMPSDADCNLLYASIIAAISTPEFDRKYRAWKAEKDGKGTPENVPQ